MPFKKKFFEKIYYITSVFSYTEEYLQILSTNHHFSALNFFI